MPAALGEVGQDARNEDVKAVTAGEDALPLVDPSRGRIAFLVLAFRRGEGQHARGRQREQQEGGAAETGSDAFEHEGSSLR